MVNNGYYRVIYPIGNRFLDFSHGQNSPWRILYGTWETKNSTQFLRHFNSDVRSPWHWERQLFPQMCIQSSDRKFWHTLIKHKVFRPENYTEDSEMPPHIKCREWGSRGQSQSGEMWGREECLFVLLIPQSQCVWGIWLTGFGTMCPDSLLPASLCILGFTEAKWTFDVKTPYILNPWQWERHVIDRPKIFWNPPPGSQFSIFSWTSYPMLY